MEQTIWFYRVVVDQRNLFNTKKIDLIAFLYREEKKLEKIELLAQVPFLFQCFRDDNWKVKARYRIEYRPVKR